MATDKPRVVSYVDSDLLERFKLWHTSKGIKSTSQGIEEAIRLLLDGESSQIKVNTLEAHLKAAEASIAKLEETQRAIAAKLENVSAIAKRASNKAAEACKLAK